MSIENLFTEEESPSEELPPVTRCLPTDVMTTEGFHRIEGYLPCKEEISTIEYPPLTEESKSEEEF